MDALQVLLVANQRQIRFNSAAHDEARRSLISYLRGKTGGEEKKYLREGDFTSYIAAEFYDHQKRETFVVGVVMDVYGDDAIDDEYFILAGVQLADLDFWSPAERWKNREEFHRYCQNLPGRHIFERSKTGYQKALLNRLGQVSERFFPVFVKALSFKPINNVRISSTISWMRRSCSWTSCGRTLKSTSATRRSWKPWKSAGSSWKLSAASWKLLPGCGIRWPSRSMSSGA
ncbi:hypothetical protein [Moorella stamsii]|uniref:hypothetical protein n=1 Tax=Neomoorella stamsii TaxID=1266720 RepID=UPI001FCA7D2E|nr:MULTISPECIES: hypothetical protein [Moorella]